MSGLAKIRSVMRGEALSPPPCLPILHSALAPLFDVSLGEYFGRPETMARVAVAGAERFGLDGVQLSLGVTAEAEALGAEVLQEADAAPRIVAHPLADPAGFAALEAVDICAGGRLPGHLEALRRTVAAVGGERYVLATIRGPLTMAAQLCGAESVMMNLMVDPAAMREFLDFCTRKALDLGRFLADSGAHGVVLGEATCSPNFIAPDSYRSCVLSAHAALVAGLREAGWGEVGMHICGNILPIAEDIVATGVDFADVDRQTPLGPLLEAVGGRIALRGNLDPSADLRFGEPAAIADARRALAEAVRGQRWILSSGCDIGAGTPPANIEALCRGAT